MRRPTNKSRGFTMVELVVSMVITSIVVGFIGMMIVTPVDAYVSQARRGELSDSAETAMRRIAVDVRGALPDSLRAGVIGGARTLDMIEVSAAADYRTWTTGESLTIGDAGDRFDMAAVQRPTPLRPLSRMVVGHGVVGSTFSVYRPTSGVITPETLSVTHPSAQRFELSAPFTFPQQSPNRRAYFVVGVTRYSCDTANGVLRRYEGVAIEEFMNPTSAVSTIIARDVTECSFRTWDSANDHGGLAIVEMTVSRMTEGNTERLRVVRQLKVENRP